MLQPFLPIQILDVQKYTHDTFRYWVKFVDHETEFKAGQFITFDLPISENKRERWRSYSIANAPNDEQVYELIIKRYENGEGGSVYITDNWAPQSVVEGRPPVGNFLMAPSTSKTSHKFFCTGVGIAPFRSIIYDIIENNIPFKELQLIFGTKKKEDILYYDEFTNLAELNEHFHYHIALSQEEYEGEPPSRIDNYLPTLVDPSDTDTAYYICGWRDMIDDMRAKLAEMGVDKKQIHFELYG